MSNLARIQRISRFFRWLFICGSVGTPFVYILFWGFFNVLPGQMIRYSLPADIPRPLPLMFRVLAIVISLIPMSVRMFGLRTLIRLFALYAQGQIFTSEHVKCFRRLGYVLLFGVGAGVIYNSLLTVLFSFAASLQHLRLSLGLHSGDITVLIVGGIVLLISWVMDEGRKLENEQALFV